MQKLPKLKKTEDYKLLEQDLENFDSFINDITNTAASDPLYNIGLNSTGISNQKVMLTIEDIEKPNVYVPVLCEVDTGIGLKETRGIHMSRCIESIFTLAKKRFKTLDDFTHELAKTVQDKQKSTSAYAEVSGIYLHKRYTQKTNLESQDTFYLLSNAVITRDKANLKTGIKAYNITACPCTQMYTKYSVVPELKSLGLNLEQINKVLDITYAGTHMQRGTMTLIVDKLSSKLTHKSLYNILDQSTHLVYELLKRPDEHDLVIRALQRPQFTEDVAREVAYNTYQRLKDILPPEAEIYVESLLNDSIHIHDVKTVIKKTLKEIKNELKAER